MPEKVIFLSSLVLLPATAIGLRFLGFKRSQSILDWMGPAATESDPERVDRARSTARMVRAAAAHGVYAAKCLPQSLVLWWILRNQGIPSELKIGLQKEPGELHAHAWIEVDTQVVNDQPDVGDRFNSLLAWNRSNS